MKLSVMVCTRNRAYAIPGCLDSIMQSLNNVAPVEAEIVVVDNGSTDNTSTLIKEWATSCPYPVNLVIENRLGIAPARNLAIREAKGDIIVFTDDDCRLHKDYVKDVLRHDAADTEPVLRGGRVVLGDPADLPLSVKDDDYAARWNLTMPTPNLQHSIRGCNMIITCNMAMRKTAIDRIGYFDERLGGGTDLPGGEDTDFVFRAYLTGVTVEYVPDMIIYHHHGRKTPEAGHKLMSNYMTAGGGLYAKYIFTQPRFCRPFARHLYEALKEFASGKNNYRPEFDFSFRDVISCNLKGAWRYVTGSSRKAA